MQITITCSGGFIWWPTNFGPVSAETLPRETADKISELIAKMDFFNLPPYIAGSPGPTYSSTRPL